MAQFRVEFLQDPASGKFLAEMYHPDRQDELLVRTEAVYASREAALLGVVQLVKAAMPKPRRPQAGKAKRAKETKKTKKSTKAKKAGKAKSKRRR